jgi:hypothetical protein
MRSAGRGMRQGKGGYQVLGLRSQVFGTSLPRIYAISTDGASGLLER